MGKKRTRNRLDRFLGLISLPVCQSGPNKMKPYRSERFLSDVEMDPLFFTKRNGLLPVEGVEAGASGSQINPDMKTDFNSANDTDTYVLELANVLAGRESLVQVHRARSIPHISRAASVKSLNCTLLHDITQNRLHQRWTYSDSELCFEIRSKISGDHPFISYSSSRRHSKCDVNYANEPVICSNEAGECHSNGDNTADAISQDELEEPECDHHTPAPLIPPGMDPSDTVTSREELHPTLVYQDECEKPKGDVPAVDTADSDMSEVEHEPAGNNAMEQDQLLHQGDNPHIPPE